MTETGCVKRDAGRPCQGKPVVEYFVGPVCAGHQLPGAQSYGSLLTGDTPTRHLTLVPGDTP